MTLKDINCCVIVPTYNNIKTIDRILESLLLFSGDQDIIAVNDGSTDRTPYQLMKYGSRLTVIDYILNTGKGHALRAGFKQAIAMGYANAITIDSDGQHQVSDIPIFLEAAAKNPGAVIMGSRDMEQEGVPGKSSFGNKFSNFWFKVETGISLPDTQTGFRLYPLAEIAKMKLYTTKFETEIEVLVRLAWRNVPIIPVKINVIYDKEERVTHFRPFKDFARISVLNTVLVVLTLLYFLPKRLIGKVKKKGLWKIIKEEAVKPEESNLSKAKSIGFGFFMGIVPVWGFQLLIGIPLSIYFRMNKVLFLAAANISIPPFIPIIIYGSYKFGGLFYKSGVQLTSFENLTLSSIHVNFVQYFIGGSLLAMAAGLVGFMITYLFLVIFRT
ncbi:DUF2062 domain-containing protein [Dyadobacter fanqingshengii]|uniref:DUF2062 domain-containing protein n=1 Tax=Dyadobacter fanqingshengii TaxID=2906443 RepID=A0A9X1PDH5_9BACT|nr:DUF2062 domain-containing protein [Dyadobacter fanqingshengii]MCF0041640.1 DUF2062 domain-containing protein [Dyadobacter fanqingshengii]USJ36644.1 DUF2062 domain-containing protein [Dyadobacter fanqingshengii]